MPESTESHLNSAHQAEQGLRWHKSEAAYFGAVLAVAITMLMGVMVFSHWNNEKGPQAHGSQTVEKPATPDTPTHVRTLNYLNPARSFIGSPE